MDSLHRRRISRWCGRFEPAARLAHLNRRPIRIIRATRRPRFLRPHADHAGGALRHVHSPEFRPLVFVLRDEPDPGVLAHQDYGSETRHAAPPKFFFSTFSSSVSMPLG